MNLSAHEMGFRQLNEMIRNTEEDIVIDRCYGERFIGSGASAKTITINGTPGNALGAYLDGASIIVNGNAQDAVGDTMNDGRIVICGSAGDALGYAMRGGKIFVKGDAGYRTGIHMKEYKTRSRSSWSGTVGSFGRIPGRRDHHVLGLDTDGCPAGTSQAQMHGGQIFIRSSKKLKYLPKQVCMNLADISDISSIKEYLNEFSELFGVSMDVILDKPFYKLTPNAKNPYKQMYTYN